MYNRFLYTSPPKSSGFSLVELMVTLAITGIIFSGGFYAMRNYIPNEDVRLIAHQLQASLLMARSEAVKRSGNAYLTPSTDGYEGGWIISTDAGRSFDGCNVTLPPNDCIFVFMNDRPVMFAGLANQVVYNRQGRIPIGGNVTVEICDKDQSTYVTKRTIEISANGFPKIISEGKCAP